MCEVSCSSDSISPNTACYGQGQSLIQNHLHTCIGLCTLLVGKQDLSPFSSSVVTVTCSFTRPSPILRTALRGKQASASWLDWGKRGREAKWLAQSHREWKILNLNWLNYFSSIGHHVWKSDKVILHKEGWKRGFFFPNSLKMSPPIGSLPRCQMELHASTLAASSA